MKSLNYCIFFVFGVFLLLPSYGFAYTYQAHQNTSEDAFLFMETKGTIQMRWVSDYLKAKAGGRYTGHCEQKTDLISDLSEADKNTQSGCGAVGIMRVGGVKPDYFRDAFWDDLIKYGWNFNVPFLKNNFTSWYHFINLLPGKADAGHTLKTDVYNDYDGYSWQASYGFPDVGLDYGSAAFMNNAWMTVDLPNCTDSACSERYSVVPQGNPALDYKQNRATTSVGQPHGAKKIGSDDRTNYNCFSDTRITGNCPDVGAKVKSGDYHYQIPNVSKADNSVFSSSYYYSNEDWVIYEPADNAATFYYNEFFLEGGQTRNSVLDKSSIAGRYYSLKADEIIYLGVVMHWATDINHIAHIWSTLGYNHGEYETWSDEWYGNRKVNGTQPQNFENFDEARAYLDARQNRYQNGVSLETAFMEQAFHTYHIRTRSGYDILTNSDDGTRKTFGKWSINNSIAFTAALFEKGVLDLRNNK
ncbi:hypothetical protein WDW89_08255 [Deltaproteobacteria bacterium TL4]